MLVTGSWAAAWSLFIRHFLQFVWDDAIWGLCRCNFVEFLIQICDNYIAALKTEVLDLWLQQIQELQRTVAYVTPARQADLLMKCLEPGAWEGQRSPSVFEGAQSGLHQLCFLLRVSWKNMLADTNSHYVSEIWVAVEGHIIPTAFQIDCVNLPNIQHARASSKFIKDHHTISSSFTTSSVADFSLPSP